MKARTTNLVRFKKSIVNLDHVLHVRKFFKNDTSKWHFRITFTTVTGTTQQYLEWVYNAESDADAAFEDFAEIIEMEVIEELP